MTILITGGGSGIGAATAKRLSARAAVIVADRNKPAAEAVAAEITAKGGKAAAVEVDVSSKASVATMMTAIESAGLEPITGLFNNAGINIRQPVAEISEVAWDTMINTHVKGVLLVSQAVLPGMLQRKRGVVVNTASDYSIIGVPGLATYCAAKTAIYAMTKAMAIEFTHLGIRVNAIGPGPIDTPLLRAGRSPADAEQRLAGHREKIPMKRLGKPEEVAAVVDFLMSDRASYIAGHIIHPNGGMVTW